MATRAEELLQQHLSQTTNEASKPKKRLRDAIKLATRMHADAEKMYGMIESLDDDGVFGELASANVDTVFWESLPVDLQDAIQSLERLASRL